MSASFLPRRTVSNRDRGTTIRFSASFRGLSRFSTWLYSIVRNLCVDHERRRQHRRHASLDERASDGEHDQRSLAEVVADAHPRASVERSVVSSQVGASIVRALEDLPEEQREVFLMREIANLPFDDIALITSCPANTVKSRMRYALDRLRAALSNFEEYARALR